MLPAVALLAAPALAIPTGTLPFKSVLPAAGTTSAKEPVLAGTVVSDKLVPFSTPAGVAPAAKGTLQVRAVKGADGKLAFYWKINVDPASQVAVKSIVIGGFPAVAYDANWRADGLGTIAPQAVAGTLPGGNWTLSFEFLNGVQAGESSRFFFLRSGATASKPAVARLSLTNNISILDVPVIAPAN